MVTNSSELTISHHIPAPPAIVWQAWSKPQHLAKWWIPAPIKCQVAKLDLQPGGGFQTLMCEGDGPFQPHVDACFLEVEPEHLLVWKTQLTQGWQPADPWLALTAVIRFEPCDGGTLYHCRVLHKTHADAQKHEELGFRPGWAPPLINSAAIALSCASVTRRLALAQHNSLGIKYIPK